MLLRRLSTKDRDCKSYGQLDVIDRRSSWNNVSLLALDQVLYFLHSFRAVNQHLGKGKVMGESVDVVWDHDVKSTLRAIDLPDLKDLHVVAEDIRSHLEWSHVNNFDIRIFKTKDTAQLCIFSLQELLHRNSFQLFNRHRVDMNLNSSPSLDRWPFFFELIHHFLPYKQRFVCELFNSILCLLLEQI